jgi:transposase-like protein
MERMLFRCTRSACRKSVSLRANSFFASHHAPSSTIMLLAYFWLNQTPVKSMVSMSGCCKQVVASFCSHFRQLVTEALNYDVSIIGGDGIIVEIDESKLGKRKYHRGHRVEGVWVVGGVERTPERRVFLLPVEEHSAATLHAAIVEHVRPGSIIHTDMWKGYDGLNELGQSFEHRTVNHSENYKDPETGVHTNGIEGTWNGLKMLIKPRNRVKEGIERHLTEFIWRRQNQNRLWEAFIEALASVYYH